MVGGGLLWGLWILLWRSAELPVALSGLFWPAAFLFLAIRKGLGTEVRWQAWLRLDLWTAYLFLFGVNVVRGVAGTAWAIVWGRVSPGIIAVPLRVKSDLSRLLLILAITASPGTIALLAEREILYVHCLRLPPGPELPGVEALQRVLLELAG